MATVTTEPGSGPRVSDVDHASAPSWVIGGVAAELAYRLRASVAFIRVLLFLVAWLGFWQVIAAYGALALLLPRAGSRRPGWRNLVAVGRLGLFLGIVFALPSVALDKTGLFGEGPAIWVPFGGTLLIGLLALLASGHRYGRIDEAKAREVVVSWATPALLGCAIAAGTVVVPGVRWELVLDVGIVSLALALIVGGRRGHALVSPIPLLLLAFVAILLGFSGARLEGGIGSLSATPRSLASVRPAYRRAIGNEMLDLRRLRGGPGRFVTTVVSVGVGNVALALPEYASGTIALRIGAGSVSAIELRPDIGVSGFVLDHTRTIWSPSGLPVPARQRLSMHVVVEVGRGCVTIVHGYNESVSAGC